MSPATRRAAGTVLQLLSLPFFAIVAFATIALRAGSKVMGDDTWIAYVAYAVAGAIAFWMWKTGKRIRIPSAEEVLATDSRAPILYLRSFVSDDVAARAEQNGLARFLPQAVPANLATEEEQIAQVMNRYGPFIGIGRKGELLPQLGAYRLNTTDDKWQAVVRDFMARSQLVVMRVGDTEGFWWEVENLAICDPRRVVFLLPKTAEQYARFRERSRPFLPKPLPEYSPKGVTDRSFGGVMWFDEQWNPTIALSKNAFNSLRNSVAADLAVKLEPVLARLTATERLVPAKAPERVLAAIADGILFALIGWAIVAGLTALHSDDILIVMLLMVLLFGYFGGFEASALRATPGKKFFGLVVLDSAGVPLELRQSMLRFFLKFMTAVSFLWVVSLILVSLDKRALHDRLAQTSVMKNVADLTLRRSSAFSGG